LTPSHAALADTTKQQERATLTVTGKPTEIEQAFKLAQERYATLDVDVTAALEAQTGFPISLQCWQGDDLAGFENSGSALDGGLAVTGNYPGKPRTPDELRADVEKALSLIPGKHRLNLHAIYGEFGGRKVGRDEITPDHFQNWIDWAKDKALGLDFNPTCFAHPRAADGLTLSHPDAAIRQFWIEHCRRSREIGAAMGRALGKACVTNIWVPDGFKDTPADRKTPRERLGASLDAIFQKVLAPEHNLDAVEPKLFGLGAESCTIGSHEFYLGYAITRQKLLCLDTGHFHPTESIADKISSVLLYLPAILLHVSRPVRWDSDHIVTFTDELQAVAREIVANRYTDRIHIGLDYFDGSINRIAAWVIGTRNLLRALLLALLEPPAIRAAETAGDNTARIALQEEARALPFGAVWDYHCEINGVPAGEAWLAEVKRYDRDVLSGRR
jgi:L-rhamnose isomerase